MTSTPERFATTAARVSLAERFNLPFHESMQDWEWEIADEARFDEFLAAYSADDLDDHERFSLMEILVQCVDDSPARCLNSRWSQIELLLVSNPTLHAFTIAYWAQSEETESCALFNVSLRMRHLVTR
jgi:hypothetical protein